MPRAQLGRRGRCVVLIAAIAALGAVAILVARWLVGTAEVGGFLATYPGETDLPDLTPVGLPPWLGWQHFLNAFFLVLIVKTGWQVRTQARPPATWVRRSKQGQSKRISLTLWTHLALDILWLANGVIYMVLLFVSGHWMRVVPTQLEP